MKKRNDSPWQTSPRKTTMLVTRPGKRKGRRIFTTCRNVMTSNCVHTTPRSRSRRARVALSYCPRRRQSGCTSFELTVAMDPDKNTQKKQKGRRRSGVVLREKKEKSLGQNFKISFPPTTHTHLVQRADSASSRARQGWTWEPGCWLGGSWRSCVWGPRTNVGAWKSVKIEKNVSPDHTRPCIQT